MPLTSFSKVDTISINLSGVCIGLLEVGLGRDSFAFLISSSTSDIESVINCPITLISLLVSSEKFLMSLTKSLMSSIVPCDTLEDLSFFSFILSNILL